MERFDNYKGDISSTGVPPPASFGYRDETKKRGKLKIFFGMSPGVGKTYSMLRAARHDHSRGVDVVVGYMNPHNHRKTALLLKGLEIVPPKNTEEEPELDLDAILARHPYLVVVDGLAHANVPGSRHAKRYQDVRELLDNGINVYTTLSLKDLESKSDVVARITGMSATETVPDDILDIADDLELIDITSSAFLDRAAQGKVHIPPQIEESAKDVILKKENVMTLRAMALRLVADRVDKQFKAYVRRNHIENPVKTDTHLLVPVDESPSFENVLRRAKNLSYSIGADMIALYTETVRGLDEEQHKQLTRNVNMARELGAQVIVTSGKSLVSTALEVARREKVTHIVVGKQFGRNIIGRLSRESNGVDIYVVNSEPEKVRSKRKFVFNADGVPSYKQYAIVLAALILIVIACLPLAWATDYHVSFIMSFSVLALSWIFRLKVGPVAFASALGAYLWVVFFVQPYNTLKGIDPHDVIAILVFFFITFATGVIASKASQNERLTKKREEKTDALFRLTDRLAQADTSEGILAIAKEEIRNHFGMEAYFILQDGVGALTREQIDAEPEGFDYSEFSIAKWAFRHSSKAGKYTNTFSVGKFTFFPLPGLNISPGVAAIRSRKRIDSETEIFLKRFLLQISGAMEHLYYSLRAKNADLMFESDRLYRGLFNSVSHELRIPVASVMGAADTLLSVEHPPEIRKELLETILAASTRLSQLIDNLLNISRLENGKISARMNWVDVNDLFNRVADSLKEELEPFRMEIIVPPSMPLVRLDFGLMEQALYNLVDNSCKYAAAGTTITLKAFYDNGYLVMQESDHGPGFVEKEMPLAFNKFYRADNQSGAGLGLGLSIVKGFIEAHGGTIGIKNRRNGGAEFTMKIPTEISYVDKV